MMHGVWNYVLTATWMGVIKMLRTHMIRAETSSPMSKDQYRHEANAFWTLKYTIENMSDTTKYNGEKMNGHELRKYGIEVIERLQRITNKINDAIQEGKDMKEDGYIYENFELKKKGGD